MVRADGSIANVRFTSKISTEKPFPMIEAQWLRCGPLKPCARYQISKLATGEQLYGALPRLIARIFHARPAVQIAVTSGGFLVIVCFSTGTLRVGLSVW